MPETKELQIQLPENQGGPTPAIGFSQLPGAIRFHRKKACLSQAELARHAGVGKTAIFDLEKGKQTIQLDTLLKVLRILNIDLLFQGPLMETYLRSSNEKSKRLHTG